MGIVDNVKQAADIAMKLGHIELSRRILDLQQEIIELTHENWELRKGKQELEESLRFSKTIRFDEPFYYAEGDEVPFCSRCRESDGKFIHLLRAAHSSQCPQCKQGFRAKHSGALPRLTGEGPNNSYT